MYHEYFDIYSRKNKNVSNIIMTINLWTNYVLALAAGAVAVGTWYCQKTSVCWQLNHLAVGKVALEACDILLSVLLFYNFGHSTASVSRCPLSEKSDNAQVTDIFCCQNTRKFIPVDVVKLFKDALTLTNDLKCLCNWIKTTISY